MNENVQMILKMVEEGKISAEKGMELLEALQNVTPNQTQERYDDRFLRVDILSNEGDKVHIKLPVKVVKEVLKVAGKLPISSSIEGMEGISIDELSDTIVSCLDHEVIGEIVDIESANGDTVKIFIG